MTDKQKKVFSQPVRRLSADEIKSVTGADGAYQNEFAGIKPSGSADNQSRLTGG